MRPSERHPMRTLASLALCLAAAGAPFVAFAQAEPPNKPIKLAPSATPSASSSAAPSPSGMPSARPLQPGEEAAPLPAGHPMVAPDSDGEDEGEPTMEQHAAVPGMFQPPPDTSQEDPTLPSGTLRVDIRDADDKPVPNVPLVLVVLHQSVAKGQSKENRPVQADANGRLLLDHLEVGSAVSYWVKAQTGPATFASSPVQMNPARGIHQVLHIYGVVRDINTALVVAQGVLYFEVKDDRIQVEEAVTFFNFGKTAWCPDNLVIKLPDGFTALTSQAQMSDQGVDSVDKQGARIRGTFAPGRHDLDFRWQLPYDGDKDVTVDVPLPPHLAIMRVMAAAGRSTTLEVSGFPEPQRRTDRQGQHVLVTEKQVKREEPLTSAHIMIRGLLTAGPGRIVASVLAALGILLGLLLGLEPKGRSNASVKSEQAELLAEIEELERARLAGDVGPKTYERTRRELVDALAQTLDAPSVA